MLLEVFLKRFKTIHDTKSLPNYIKKQLQPKHCPKNISYVPSVFKLKLTTKSCKKGSHQKVCWSGVGPNKTPKPFICISIDKTPNKLRMIDIPAPLRNRKYRFRTPSIPEANNPSTTQNRSGLKKDFPWISFSP